MLHDLIWNEAYIAIDEVIILNFLILASLFITKRRGARRGNGAFVFTTIKGFDWWRADKGQ